MRVLCIRGSRFLIKGEWYKVIDGHKTIISLQNHTNIRWSNSWYHKDNFITEQEWRDQQLNKLLNE